MTKGASTEQRLLSAARDDNEEILLETIDAGADINCRDGAGNTPLHLAVKYANQDILEHILSHEQCDVDPINPITGETPLHYAIQLEDEDDRAVIVESLLEAGADISVKDKNGNTILDILPIDDTQIRPLIRKSQAQNTLSAADIASDDEGPGSGSGSESE